MRDTSEILAEIDTRVAARREAARRRGGPPLLAPLLMLGTMERVGSNWLSDTLRVLMDQHNEPLRQQLAADHPLSPLNPDGVGLSQAGRLTPYGRHGLIAFSVSKYAPTRQVIKETNLFLAVPNVLALFPDAPVVVLTRSPLGVASSFVRRNLFARWDYRARYQQIVAATQRADAPLSAAAALVPDDDPPDLVALARLHTLNTLLLAAALDSRPGQDEIVCVPYESAVRSPAAGWRALVRLLPELAGTSRPAHAACARTTAPAERAEDTFVTTVPKTALTAHLTPEAAEHVRSAAEACLATGQQVFPARIAALAGEWLAGDHLYELTPPPSSRLHPTTTHGPADGVPTAIEGRVEGRYVVCAGVAWRTLLVTNAEYARFLNELAQHGLHNSSGGAYLLCCPMPHERGGRLHHNPGTGQWTVSPGFEHHPASWVTWIGAAAFAARHGARLPLLAEMKDLMIGARPTNTDYQVGDTSPVIQHGIPADGIHHRVGNVQVWCLDGPDPGDGPASRWLTGAAWNTPSTWEEIIRLRHRHLAGSSRGVGIRLIADDPGQPMPADLVAGLLEDWMSGLAERTLPLRELDERLIATFTRSLPGSQADVGLGTHVGACPGPSGLSELDEPRGEAKRGQIGQGHELHAADRRGVGARRNVSHGAAGAGGLERHVHDVGVAAGQMVAHVQQPAHADLDAGLLAHLPHQRLPDGLAWFDLPAGQGPRAAGVGVLVQEQNPVVLDEHAGDSYLHHLRKVSQQSVPSREIEQAKVVIAAGGLGTRVRPWARYLPKEWLPVHGAPGIVRLLEEIAVLGEARVVIVYHPYYEPFVAWARHALAAEGGEGYLSSAGLAIPPDGAGSSAAGLRVEWVAQAGAYGDLTSLINGADHLADIGDELFVAYGDNLYPEVNPLAQLRQAPPGVTILSRAYDRALAQQRGVIATQPGAEGTRRVIELVEKPSSQAARELESRYGAGNLRLVEGRTRLDSEFVDFARSHRSGRGAEPRLSLLLGEWAGRRPVHVVTTSSAVVDLGAPVA